MNDSKTSVQVEFDEIEMMRLKALIEKSGLTVNEYFRRAVGF